MNKILTIVGLTACLLVSCDKNQDQEEFDRKAMLSDMASGVIVPAVNDLSAQLSGLHNAALSFTASTDQTNLDLLQTSFEEAYRSFQKVKMFDFGPMMDFGVKASMNTYPTDTTEIQSNINSGSYNLSAADMVNAIGFPALDFLLYYQGNAAVLSSFTTDPNASNRLTYLTDLTDKMKTEFDLVADGWSSYEAEFINADGNDVGSSTSALFNEFVKDLELVKNAKIGIPAGEFSGGMPLPTYVEAYYSGISIELAVENMNGLKNAFNGGSGKGLDDYIKDVQGEDVLPSLADNINLQFDYCISKMNSIGNPLSDKITAQPTSVNEAFLELKKLVTMCKTDVSSTLGLLITFQDNDGD